MTKSRYALNIKTNFSAKAGDELGSNSERNLVPVICRLLTPTGL